jgi:hypothetical protein
MTPIRLPTVIGHNNPSRLLSEARGYCWKQFTLLLIVLATVFYGLLFAGQI